MTTKRLSAAIAAMLHSATEVANAAEESGIEIEIESNVIGRDGDPVIGGSPFGRPGVHLPNAFYDEWGWSRDHSPLGGWRHRDIDDAVNWLADQAISDPYAQQALDQVRFWIVFHFDQVPDRFVPDDIVAANNARQAANRWWGVMLAGGKSYDFAVRDPSGLPETSTPEYDGKKRHRVQFLDHGETPEAFAERTAAAIRTAPARLRHQAAQAAQDAANGVVRPPPGPKPNP